MSFLAGCLHASPSPDPAAARAVVLAAAAQAESRGLARFGFEVGPWLGVAVAEDGDTGAEALPLLAEDGRCGVVLLGTLRERSEDGGRSQDGSAEQRVLARYREGGEAALAELEGDYVLCLWDHARDLCLIAHGPSGTRPLFVTVSGARIAFASEPGLLSDCGAPALSPEGALQFLARGMVAPGLDGARLDGSVRRLDPGATLRCRGGVLSRRLPADPPAGIEAEGSFVERLAGAVTPGPATLLLSGGIYAGGLAAAMAAAGGPVSALAIGFPGLNEFELAGAFADRFGLILDAVEIAPETVLDGIDSRFAAYGLPVDDVLLFLLNAGVECAGVGPGRRLLAGIGGRALFGEEAAPDELAAGTIAGLVRGGRCAESLLRLSLWTRRWEATGASPGTDDTGRLAGAVAPPFASHLRRRGVTLELPYASSGPLAGWARSARRQAGLEGQPIRRFLRARMPGPLAEASGLREAAPNLPSRQVLLDGRRDRVLDRLAAVRGSGLAEVLDLDAAERRVAAHYDGDAPDALLVWRLFVLAAWFAAA